MHEICSKLKIKTLERRFTHFSGVSSVDFEQANGNIILTPKRSIFPSYRNQSVDLSCKSADWFLYDGNIGH